MGGRLVGVVCCCTCPLARTLLVKVFKELHLSCGIAGDCESFGRQRQDFQLVMAKESTLVPKFSLMANYCEEFGVQFRTKIKIYTRFFCRRGVLFLGFPLETGGSDPSLETRCSQGKVVATAK